MDMLWNLLRTLRARPAPHQAEALAVLSQAHDASEWCALSRHPNGYIREGAVRQLALSNTPEQFVALVERLNDWVPEIREHALQAIQTYLRPEHTAALLTGLEPLIELAEKRRADHSGTLDQVRTVLLHPQARATTLQTFLVLRGRAARFLFELLAGQETDLPTLLEAALKHLDVSVRRLAMAHVAVRADAAVWASRMLEDSYAPLRAEALRLWLPSATPAQAHAALRKALHDCSFAVLDLALWTARQWGLDPSEVLHERLAAAPPRRRREWAGMLMLIRALPERTALPVVQAALEAPSPRVREQALSVLAQVAPDTLEEALLSALGDHAPRVFKQAVRLLQASPSQRLEPSIDHLLETHWEALDTERRDALLHLKPHWRQAAWLLRRYNGAQSAYWLAQIQRWCDRAYASYDVITPWEERERLKGGLQQLEDSGRLKPGSTRRAS